MDGRTEFLKGISEKDDFTGWLFANSKRVERRGFSILTILEGLDVKGKEGNKGMHGRGRVEGKTRK